MLIVAHGDFGRFYPGGTGEGTEGTQGKRGGEEREEHEEAGEDEAELRTRID